MALINHVKREINAKLVYFGPAHSGKATNLNVIYKKLNPECRGKLKSMAVQNDRMLFFDFALPGQGEVDGYRVRFHVYTLAGKVSRGAAWKMVLKGADGVVFVADSAPDKMSANRESLATLQELLQDGGNPLPRIPCVFQCNKRDLATALPLEELRRAFFPAASILPATARKGEGVFDVLSQMVQMVLKDLRDSGLDVQSTPAEFGRMEEAASGAICEEPIGLSPRDAEVVEPGLQGAPTKSEGTVRPPVPGSGLTVEGAEPVIECAGNPEILDDGCVRLPLVVRCGGQEKKLSLSVSISLKLD